MSTAGGPSRSSAAAEPREPPELRRMRFADFPAVQRLESDHFRHALAPEDRRRMFEGSPLWPGLAERWPLGWVLEDVTGAIVGSVTNVPSLYLYRGEEKICGNGFAWTVAEEHRGYAALLMDAYFTQDDADLVVASNVGVHATPIWQAYGHPVPLGDWVPTAYAVTDRRSFARTVLRLKGVPLARTLAAPAAAALAVADSLRSRPLPRTPDGVEIECGRTFDDRFDVFWDELRARNHDVLLAARDRATLEWHFRLLRESGRLRVYAAIRDGRLRAYCLVKRYERPSGMRCMRIVDYQSVDDSTDLLPGLVRAAAAGCAEEGACVLEHRGCGIPKMRAFDRFAPHRQARPAGLGSGAQSDLGSAAWSFHYRTSDPVLADDLTRPGAWDPSEYDGDASYV